VPVLKLVATNWPGAASAAAISAWYQATAVQPSAGIPLANVVDPDQIATAPVVSNLPGGGRIRVDAGFVDGDRPVFRVRVIEQHAAPAAASEWYKVSPPNARDLRPNHITRQFDERHRTAVHKFDYEITSAGPLQQLQSAAIAIAAREQCVANAPHAASVIVSVSPAGDLLPLATGRVESPPRSTSSAAEIPR
jgi:hypothetical protein